MLYLTIEKPAPNFHIYIQRTALVSKNLNRVLIPEVVYLDRYMDTDERSKLYSLRKRAWNLSSRLSQIEEQLAAGARIGQPTAGSAYVATPGDTSDANEEWDMVDLSQASSLCDTYGQPKLEITSVKIEDPLPPPQVTGGAEFGGEDEPDLLAQRTRLSEERNALFDGMQKVKYRLHAVLCHIGTGRAGHYWAWVYDFEKGSGENTTIQPLRSTTLIMSSDSSTLPTTANRIISRMFERARSMN